MRLVLVISGLLGVWSPAMGQGRPEFEVIDVMPRFWAFWDSTTGRSAEERVSAFRATVVAPHAAFYREVLGAPDDKRIAGFLERIEGMVPAMRRASVDLVEAIAPTWRELRAMFPDLVPGVKVYVVPSVFTSNGQVRYLDDSLVVMLGPDVQAYVETVVDSGRRTDPALGIRHELTHYHHWRVNPEIAKAAKTFFNPGAHSSLYYNLWSEGFATYVTKLLSPGVPLASVLGPGFNPDSDAHLVPKLAREFLDKMESTSERDLRDLFYLASDRRTDIPARSAYYIGFRVAERLANHYSLPELTKLRGSELRDGIREALSAFAQSRE